MGMDLQFDIVSSFKVTRNDFECHLPAAMGVYEIWEQNWHQNAGSSSGSDVSYSYGPASFSGQPSTTRALRYRTPEIRSWGIVAGSSKRFIISRHRALPEVS